MDIRQLSYSLLKGTVLGVSLLFATMNVANSAQNRIHNVAHRAYVHTGVHHEYHRGYDRGYRHNYDRRYRHYYGDRGWRRGGVVTYPNRCIWVPPHTNRWGRYVPGHRSC